jgi:oxygen-independent coproporphyrinogen-3 oxidase
LKRWANTPSKSIPHRHPRTLAHLAQLGFNRLSFGVQDFDPDVQKAVHREQPAEQVFDLVQAARELGFHSVNVDLIYGLPKQTAASFQRTLEQVCQLRPDRIALYAYAHLPERFKPQRRIAQEDLPEASDKLSMLSGSIDAFMQAGYVYGHGPLRTAGRCAGHCQAAGRLHRNFQGYSTQPDCDLIALGCLPSAAWAPPTARTPRPWKSITTSSIRASCPWCGAWRWGATTWCGAPSSCR